MSMMDIQDYLKAYLCERPLFLSLIRAKEAFLYQKYLPLKRPVLDVGCGDGYFAKITFAKNFQFPISNFQLDVGLDVKESRINEARKLDIYKKLVIYDGVKIPFPDNYFSTIVSNCVLEHVTELEAVLKEAYRVLKPGGVFLATVMAKPWEDYLFGTKLLGVWYQNWMRKKQVHRNLLSKNKWDEEFVSTGFRIKEAIGYLTPQSCKLIDVCHYLSIPSLVSYKLFRKWVLWESVVCLYPLRYWVNTISINTTPEKSGALFYLLVK